MHRPHPHPHHHQPCLDCGQPTQERLNYFTGQFLAARDFRAEQLYHIDKHRQHNRYLHGYGTVCGLRVVQHSNEACRDRYVIVEPGLALDGCGREIFVPETQYVDVGAKLAPQKADPTQTGKHLLISLCYQECETEFVPALYAECGCTDTGCEANRIYEGFEIEAKLVDDDKLPKPQVVDPSGVQLEWTTTLTTDKALRVAIDPKQTRIYVLNAATPHQIMVYDTEHYCLLKSISFVVSDGRIIDLAVSTNGNFLYVLRYVEGASPGSGNYFLRVIQVKNTTTGDDLNPVQPIVSADASQDIPLTSRSEAIPPRFAVGSKDTSGKVVTLDLNATPNKKITIWTDRINTNGANPAAVSGNADYAKYYEGDTGDARAIAISPDGSWLFIAEAGSTATSNIVKAFNIGTRTVIHSIPIPVGETASLLEVSGDSLWLYVITETKKMYVFRIQETPTLFPSVNTIGVDLGTDTPIALQVSPTGKWGYVLLSDATKGWVKVINRDKLDDPGQAVSGAIAVAASPRDLALAIDGRRLYAAGEGAAKGCGGVSVLNVSEDQCKDLFWRSLEPCPEFREACIPLAVVMDYATDQVVTDARIKNEIRPLVPSTETLQKVILCALNSVSKSPAPGTDTGVKSVGELEPDLTQIIGLSWEHRKNGNFVFIDGEAAIVIGFSRPVNVGEIDKHIFEVLIQSDSKQEKRSSVSCWCPVKGKIVPVNLSDQESSWKPLIEDAQLATGPFAFGAAFIPQSPKLLIDQEIWIRLRGDFVIDEGQNGKPGRAIDAEFVRGELPTGDRPQGSKFGVQGGLFESWFLLV
jgi:DNA-binding beta-propeller fold protein YncE